MTLNLGSWEYRMEKRAGFDVDAFLGLSPKTARVMHDDGKEEHVPMNKKQMKSRPCAEFLTRAGRIFWSEPPSRSCF